MSAPFKPPRPPGLATLAPEIARIVDALALAQVEREYQAARTGELQKPGFRPSQKLKP